MHSDGQALYPPHRRSQIEIPPKTVLQRFPFLRWPSACWSGGPRLDQEGLQEMEIRRGLMISCGPMVRGGGGEVTSRTPLSPSIQRFIFTLAWHLAGGLEVGSIDESGAVEAPPPPPPDIVMKAMVRLDPCSELMHLQREGCTQTETQSMARDELAWANNTAADSLLFGSISRQHICSWTAVLLGSHHLMFMSVCISITPLWGVIESDSRIVAPSDTFAETWHSP